MIALLDFVPKFCPVCGTPFSLISHDQIPDFFSGASFGCQKNCGITYAYAETQVLRIAATSAGSDLARYA